MFPFSDINRNDVVECSDCIEDMLRIQNVIHPLNINGNDQVKVRVVAFSLQFLKQEKNFGFKNSHFIDCLGYGCEACLYAQIFGFKSLSSVEFNSESFQIGSNWMNQLATTCPMIFQEDRIKLGRGLFLDDYSATNFRCFYLDTTLLRSSILDESILINRFLQFCSNAVSGSFFILVTIASSISLSDYYPHGEEIFRHEFSSDIGEYAAGITIFSTKRT
jgi:hypothetical protein